MLDLLVEILDNKVSDMAFSWDDYREFVFIHEASSFDPTTDTLHAIHV